MADMWLKFKAGAQAAGNSASKAAEKTKLQGEIALLKRVPAPVAFRRARSLVPLLGARSRAPRRRLGRVRRVARSRARSAVDASAPQAMGLLIYDALRLFHERTQLFRLVLQLFPLIRVLPRGGHGLYGIICKF